MSLCIDVTDDDLAALLARIPAGWSPVRYAGRSYGMTRTDLVGGRSVAVYAEELGGTDVISTNVYRTAAADLLRPCEMPAEKVLAFLRGWRPFPSSELDGDARSLRGRG